MLLANALNPSPGRAAGGGAGHLVRVKLGLEERLQLRLAPLRLYGSFGCRRPLVSAVLPVACGRVDVVAELGCACGRNTSERAM